MTAIGIYSMKGGVGKTTAAVNLAHHAATAGHRVLLWDLDPQAASSFTFRVEARVRGFGRKGLESGDVFGDAIRATDYENLDLLPADFAYRKLDRLLDRIGKPRRVIPELLDRLGRGYDFVLLDCPPGFSRLTEGVFAAARALLVPTIPTVLSLRAVARLVKWADRSESAAELTAFFSMVDRRKLVHRRTCEWARAGCDIFMATQVPYASIVEQTAVRRMPIAIFAPRDPAAIAFAGIWRELEERLAGRSGDHPPEHDRRVRMLAVIDALIERLESADAGARPRLVAPPAADAVTGHPAAGEGGVGIIHRFDTGARDLERAGCVLELREGRGHFGVALAFSDGTDGPPGATRRLEARIDGVWARRILAGEISPLAALEQRAGRPGSALLTQARAALNDAMLSRVESRLAAPATGPRGAPGTAGDQDFAPGAGPDHGTPEGRIA